MAVAVGVAFCFVFFIAFVARAMERGSDTKEECTQPGNKPSSFAKHQKYYILVFKILALIVLE